jgi:hypothetical protein
MNKADIPVTYDPHRLTDAVRLDLDRPGRAPTAVVSDAQAAQHLLRKKGRLWRIRHKLVDGGAGKLIEAADRQQAYETFVAYAESRGLRVLAEHCRGDQLKA